MNAIHSSVDTATNKQRVQSFISYSYQHSIPELTGMWLSSDH